QQIFRLAVQRRAEAVQDFAVERFRPVVEQCVQARVCNTRFFLQAIPRPAFLPQNVLQSANDHSGLPLTIEAPEGFSHIKWLLYILGLIYTSTVIYQAQTIPRCLAWLTNLRRMQMKVAIYARVS